jgi:hypothetical protein
MSDPTQETETSVALTTGKALSDQIDYILSVEASGYKYDLESFREEADNATYPEIVEVLRDVTILVLSLAHRVRELEGEA